MIQQSAGGWQCIHPLITGFELFRCFIGHGTGIMVLMKQAIRHRTGIVVFASEAGLSVRLDKQCRLPIFRRKRVRSCRGPDLFLAIAPVLARLHGSCGCASAWVGDDCHGLTGYLLHGSRGCVSAWVVSAAGIT